MDSASQHFAVLCRKAGVKAPGGPYLFRHIFRTVADETHDVPAIDVVMGHADNSMAAHYRETVADERLQAVVDHVRAWLLAGRPTEVASTGGDS